MAVPEGPGRDAPGPGRVLPCCMKEWMARARPARGSALAAWVAGGVLALACSGEGSGIPVGAAGGAGAPASEGSNGLDVLYDGELDPSGIAIDERYLYWASEVGLRRAPLEGGEPITLVAGSNLGAVVPAGEHVYFLESTAGSGRLARVRRDGGEPQHLADVERARGLLVNGERVYWTDQGASIQSGSLMRAALDGSDVLQLAGNLAQPFGLALDGGAIYFAQAASGCGVSPDGTTCFGGGTWRVSIDGGEPERVSAARTASNFVWTERGMYWLASSPPRVMLMPPDGIEREVVGIGQEGAGELTADARALYWASEDDVLRLPLDGEPVLTPLVSDLRGASSIVLHEGSAIVTESEAGRILRVATDGSANRPPEPITGPCPAPIGSGEELALTPRAEPSLELLGLSLEPELERVTVTQATYDRLVADVAAIRALEPGLADIDYRPRHDGKTLYLAFTGVGARSVAAGQYTAWDCLNDVYGVTSLATGIGVRDRAALLALEGTYDMARLATLYAQLPEVESAQANGTLDGPTLCAARDGDRHEYVIDRAGGDCPEGCTEHEAFYFESTSAGQITAGGRWSSESDGPAPEWFARICN